MVKTAKGYEHTAHAVRITDVPKEDLNWSTVALSEIIERDYRLEASVFGIEGKHAREVISKSKWNHRPICGDDGIAYAYHRPRFKRIFVAKSQYPIYQPAQINEIYPKPRLFISDKTKVDIDALRVKKNQILLTCSGTIGNSSIVNKTLDGCIFSHDLIRITAYREVDAGYLYAFLNTKIGKELVLTNYYGAVVTHIEPEHLEKIKIPNASTIIKNKINDLIMKSFGLRDESNELIDRAQRLLTEELKLPPIDKIKPVYFDRKAGLRNYSVKLSNLHNRLDGSYHVPTSAVIIKHLNKTANGITTIGDPKMSTRIILPGRFKRVYVEEGQGVVFFGGKQLYELDPNGKKYLSLGHHSDRIKNELFIKENMILITCSGTIAKVTIAPEHWEDWTINQHVIRVVPANESVAGYIYCWLASDYGYELIKRFTYGAVVDEIDDNHMAQVEIPILKDKKSQKRINDLVLEANRKRYEAYQLEQKAIKLMDDKVIYAQK